MKFCKLFIFTLFSLFIFFVPLTISAQSLTPPAEITPVETISKAKVLDIIFEGEREIAGKRHPYQEVQLKIIDGEEKDQTITVMHGETTTLREEQKVQEGNTIVLLKTVTPNLTFLTESDNEEAHQFCRLTVLSMSGKMP